MIWMALLAASLTLGRREMVAVTLFTDFLPEKPRVFVDLLVQVIVFLVAATFLYWSVVWMMSPAAMRDVVITLAVKKWYPYLIVPVFFFTVWLAFCSTTTPATPLIWSAIVSASSKTNPPEDIPRMPPIPPMLKFWEM